MAIDAVGASNTSLSATRSNAFGNETTQALQDQFMQILITQLRYQDPMEPLKEQEFLAQMAQFSSATQIGELNRTVTTALEWMMTSQANQNLLSAARLIGNTFMAEVDQEIVEGVIESVVFDEGRIMVKSGQSLIPVESLFYIGAPPVDDAESLAEGQTEGQVEQDASQGN